MGAHVIGGHDVLGVDAVLGLTLDVLDLEGGVERPKRGVLVEGLGEVVDSHGRLLFYSRYFSANATSACSKTASGGRTSPAPTWPTPGSRWAMPVLMRGRRPSSTTLRMSIPVGVPRKSRAGMVKSLCSATVISYISRVVLRASRGVPLTKVTIAGAAAMAKPPMPAVSVIVLSPMSALASCRLNPGKYSPSGISAGAVNQASPSPLTRMPKSVPLRAMVVTSVLPSTPCAASAIALQAAMTGLSTLRALSAINA